MSSVKTAPSAARSVARVAPARARLRTRPEEDRLSILKRSVKERIRGVVELLPNNVTMERAMYELYVAKKIYEGLDAHARGDVISHEELGAELSKWLDAK